MLSWLGVTVYCCPLKASQHWSFLYNSNGSFRILVGVTFSFSFLVVDNIEDLLSTLFSTTSLFSVRYFNASYFLNHSILQGLPVGWCGLSISLSFDSFHASVSLCCHWFVSPCWQDHMAWYWIFVNSIPLNSSYNPLNISMMQVNSQCCIVAPQCFNWSIKSRAVNFIVNNPQYSIYMYGTKVTTLGVWELTFKTFTPLWLLLLHALYQIQGSNCMTEI